MCTLHQHRSTTRTACLRLAFVIVTATIAIAPPRVGAAPVEEIYVLNTFGANVDRFVPSTGETTIDLFDAGSGPNEIRIQGRTAYITSSFSNELVRADLNAGAVIDEIPLSPEVNPWSVAVVGARAYVSNFVTSTVSVVDLVAGAAIDAIPVGLSPEGLLLADGRLYVANTALDLSTFVYGPGSVSVIDLASGSLIDSIPTGLNPQALARDAMGRIHVVCTGDYATVFGEIDVIDPVSLDVEKVIPLGGSPGLVAIDEGGTGYASSYFEGLLVYDAESGVPLRDSTNPVGLGGPGAGGLLPAGGGGVWVTVSGGSNLLLRVAPPERAFAIEDTVAVGNGPLSLARSRAFVPPPVPARVERLPAPDPSLRVTLLTPTRSGHLGARLRLTEASPVSLALYDLSGRRVTGLEAGALPAGETEISWELAGRGIATGRYLLCVRAGEHLATRPILLTR